VGSGNNSKTEKERKERKDEKTDRDGFGAGHGAGLGCLQQQW